MKQLYCCGYFFGLIINSKQKFKKGGYPQPMDQSKYTTVLKAQWMCKAKSADN